MSRASVAPSLAWGSLVHLGRARALPVLPGVARVGLTRAARAPHALALLVGSRRAHPQRLSAALCPVVFATSDCTGAAPRAVPRAHAAGALMAAHAACGKSPRRAGRGPRAPRRPLLRLRRDASPLPVFLPAADSVGGRGGVPCGRRGGEGNQPAQAPSFLVCLPCAGVSSGVFQRARLEVLVRSRRPGPGPARPTHTRGTAHTVPCSCGSVEVVVSRTLVRSHGEGRRPVCVGLQAAGALPHLP